MSANRTRVPVRGTIGKSVQFPTGTSGSGATIGVDFKLPDGSVPTLQQLAAALVTGSAIQDQPGNIVPPGGGATVIWQNVQYVPANVQYPARPVPPEEEAGEEYYRMAMPGPIGVRGPQGFSGVFADDPEDPISIPGSPGATGPAGPLGLIYLYPDDPEDPGLIPGAPGTAGSQGPPGLVSAVHLWPDDPEDPISIPGSQGPPGNNGNPGSQGPVSTIHMYPDDPEDPGLIPGAAGPAGTAGASGPAGAISAVHLWPDDPEDPITIPGAVGPAGTAGASGPPGVISAVHLWPDDPEDYMPIPGAAGAAGITGATGPPGLVSAVHLWPDDPEDPSQFLGPQGPVGATGGLGPQGAAPYFEADSGEDYPAIQGGHVWPGGPLVVNGPLTVNGIVNGANIQEWKDGTNKVALFTATGLAAFGTLTATDLQLWAGNALGLTLTQAGLVQVAKSPMSSTKTQVATGLANFLSASTARTSNVLVAEAGMTVTCNETGWYAFTALLLINETTAGTGGVAFDFAGGTATLANTRYTSAGISNGAAYANAARATTALTGLSPVTTTATPDWSLCTGVIQVTVAGTFGLRWSQNTTLAIDPSNLLVGSNMVLTKIG